MKVCSVTGHRVLGKDFSAAALEEKLTQLVLGGVDTFCIGMAQGFDLLCGEILCNMKEFYGLRLVACIPCADQCEKYPPREKARYNQILARCDETIILHEFYVNGCMFERNRLLVDKCDVLLAYLRTQRGGTFYTVNYAKKAGKPVVCL